MQQIAFFLTAALFGIAVGPPSHLPAATGYLNIYALPVGQGDCTVIQCPKKYGGAISVIDIGSSNSVGMDQADVAAYLSGERIEAVILTHYDKDHINYLDAILAPLPLASYPTVFHSCPWSYYKKYVTNPHLTASKNTGRLTKCCGWKGCPKIDICNGYVALNILGSAQNNCDPNDNPNGDSVVTLITYGMTDTLVVGDFEGGKTFIADFLKCNTDKYGNSYLKSEIYRLSHHGADNGLANTPPFLAAVGVPYYVFSGSGLNSGYGHPRCTFKTYYASVTKMVASHPYTCFINGDGIDKSPTTVGIYVTSLLNSKNYIHNYIIQFAIGTTGKITPYFTEYT